MRSVPVEKPFHPLDRESEDARRRQRDRYINGEFVYPGQKYDARQVLEAALANVGRACGRPPAPASGDDDDPGNWRSLMDSYR